MHFSSQLRLESNIEGFELYVVAYDLINFIQLVLFGGVPLTRVPVHVMPAWI